MAHEVPYALFPSSPLGKILLVPLFEKDPSSGGFVNGGGNLGGDPTLYYHFLNLQGYQLPYSLHDLHVL